MHGQTLKGQETEPECRRTAAAQIVDGLIDLTFELGCVLGTDVTVEEFLSSRQFLVVGRITEQPRRSPVQELDALAIQDETAFARRLLHRAPAHGAAWPWRPHIAGWLHLLAR